MFLEALIVSIFAVLIGLTFAFSGYRFFRILLPIWAFFAGLMFGISGLAALTSDSFLSAALGLIVGLVVGIIFALIAYFAYSLAVILFGASLGFALGQGFLLLIGFNEGFLPWLMGIFMAVVFAVAFMKTNMPRLVIIIATGLGGAMAVITGIFILFGQVPASMSSMSFARVMVDNSFIWTVLWIALGGLGIMVQYMTEKQNDLMQPYDWDALVVTPSGNSTAEVTESEKTDSTK